MRASRGHGGGQQFGLPPLSARVRNLFIALVGLYAVELALRNVVGAPIDALVWLPFRSTDFALYQPLTRYFIQGNSVISVLIGVVVLYFFLPQLESSYSDRQQLEVVGFAAAGGTLFAGALDLIGILRTPAPAFGWDGLVTIAVVLFGLTNPKAVIHLFFVLPVRASLFVWGTGLLAALFLLAVPALDTADYLGVWLGVMAWWRWRGPEARKRVLRDKAKNIERELRNFEVLEGGRRNNRPFDDDVVH